MKTIIQIFFLTIIMNISIFGMDDISFSSFLSNLEKTIDFYKIEMIENLSNETYTSEQAQKILSKFSIGSNRIDAFKLLALKIEEPENKGLIINAFQQDISSYKSDAYKILNEIKTSKKKPIPQKDETVFVKEENQKGIISLEVVDNNCVTGGDHFHFNDQILFSFQANKEVGVTSLQFWISECKNSNDNSCTTPFLKKEKDILPDWKGFKYETPISLYNLMSNSGKVKIPSRYDWYHFAIIINSKIVAEKNFKIKNTCE